MVDEEEGNWIEIDDREVDLTISTLAESMGEEEAREFLKAQGMNPDQLLEAFNADSLSEVEMAGFRGNVTSTKVGPIFSNIHLQTAVELWEQIKAYEEVPGDSEEWGKNMNWGLVVASVTSCMSFLDAIANEFIDDISGSNIPSHALMPEQIHEAGFDQNFQDLLEQLESEAIEWRHMSTPQKYQTILALSDEEKFDKGSQPYQDIDVLRRLRNYFVHFNPEFYEEDQEEVQHQLGSALQGKFDLNPLADESDPYFPHKCLSSGCAEWAIETSVDFSDSFFNKFDLEPDYQRRDIFSFGKFV